MTDELAKIKARLAPYLSEPYFEVQRAFMSLAMKKCDHKEHGVILDELDRAAICRNCRREIDPFEALLNYAHAEERLVNAVEALRESGRREAQKLARVAIVSKCNRKVVSREPVRNLELKAEPIIGYKNTLGCGHVRETTSDREFKTLMCYDCEKALATA
jgi:hypothetical protein